MSCSQCFKWQKKLRVLVSDHEFQLRKLRQDKAEQRALYQLSIQKELRKWQQRYNKQKQDHEEDNKKWLNKIDETVSVCQQKIRQYQKLSEDMIHQQRKQTSILYQMKTTEMSNHYEKEIKYLKETHEQYVKSITYSHNSQIFTLENKYHEQIEKIKKDSIEREQSLTKQYESSITGLKSQKLAEQKQNAKLQQQIRRQRTKYFGQIYDNKAKISLLQTKINDLNLKIKEKEEQLQKTEISAQQQRQNHKLELEYDKRQKQNIIKYWEGCLQSQLKQYYLRELDITEQYQKAIKNIDEKRQNQQKLYENNLHEVRACIENRPSRVQDVQEILILREKLLKKERQYECLQRQVKNYQLQIQNKEDTYNKIFIPSVNSTHLNQGSAMKRKQLKMKRTGKSISTVRDILNAINAPPNNLPTLNNVDKKMLPPRSTKIL